jgi:glycosyltransferase involved in cell wall biosynthesis
MRVCIVIPFFNHGAAIGGVLESVRPLGLPCFIVDDGSDAPAKAALARAVTSYGSGITALSLPQNSGKGTAVIAGCETAFAEGFTHAVQIDADGQHQVADIAKMITIARTRPEAIVTGQAVYDDSVPRARLYGRYLTHLWVWINTLSLEIKDSMCGLRIYPLAGACAVWRRHRIGRRMDFDIEIIVRMSWAGVAVINMPTHVTYPKDGVSHFKALRDNALISATHARLFCGMLLRLPQLLARRLMRLPTSA